LIIVQIVLNIVRGSGKEGNTPEGVQNTLEGADTPQVLTKALFIGMKNISKGNSTPGRT
jgi:hypothetical protein